MNVIPLPIRKRSGGVTPSDTRQVTRFIFARPGWRVAERLSDRNEAYLQISVDRPDLEPALTWHLSRSETSIFVHRTDAARTAGPYRDVHDAILSIWEEAERLFARLHAKPIVLLCGMDPIAAVEFQDIALIAGFEPLIVPEAEIEAMLSTDIAAAVVDLKLHPTGGDGRGVIRLLRQRWRNLPVLALTIHAPTAPEADLHGLGGPTHRERLPHDPDRVLHWLLGVFETHDPEGLSRRPS